MNQLREAVSIPVESRMSPRTPRKSSRSPQTEHKPNAMNPAYMLTMARPIASNLSAVPSDASPQLRPSCTRALNRAADAPVHPLALFGEGKRLDCRRGCGQHAGHSGSGRRWPCLHLPGSAGKQSLATAINCPRLIVEGSAVRLSSAASAMLSRAVAAVLARHRALGCWLSL